MCFLNKTRYSSTLLKSNFTEISNYFWYPNIIFIIIGDCVLIFFSLLFLPGIFQMFWNNISRRGIILSLIFTQMETKKTFMFRYETWIWNRFLIYICFCMASKTECIIFQDADKLNGYFICSFSSFVILVFLIILI